MKELALQIIKKSFEGKKDKAGKPYINHLHRVASKVAAHGESVEVVALLHDLLEDCPYWTGDALRCLFTEAIANSVEVLTKKVDQSYGDYITGVINDSWAITVKKADLEDNMDITRLNDLTDKDIERLRKYHAAYRRIMEAY